MDLLRRKSEDTFRFLNICSFLSTTINDSLMYSAPVFKERDERKTRERVTDAKHLLYSFSMLDPMVDGVNIHQLVQEAVFLRSTQEERISGFWNAAAILKEIYSDLETESIPEKVRNCLTHSESILRKFLRHFEEYQGAPPFELTYGYAIVNDKFFISAARLGINVSETLVESLIQAAHCFFGPSNLKTAKVIAKAGIVLGRQGLREKERELLKRALSIYSSFFGENHVEVARTLISLGKCYVALGDLHKGKEMLERALKINQSFYDDEHFEVANTLEILGNCYNSLGDHHKGRELLKKALSIKLLFYGEHHVEVANVRELLGECYGKLGDYHRMKEMLERALIAKQNFYGDDHFYVATCLYKIADCCRSLKNYEESIVFLKKAAQILERIPSALVYLCEVYFALSQSFVGITDLFVRKERYDLLEAKEYLEKLSAVLLENKDNPQLESWFSITAAAQKHVDNLLSAPNPMD